MVIKSGNIMTKKKVLAHHIGIGHKITFVPHSIEGIGFTRFYSII